MSGRDLALTAFRQVAVVAAILRREQAFRIDTEKDAPAVDQTALCGSDRIAATESAAGVAIRTSDSPGCQGICVTR
jgi:hypothetical protein